MGCGDVGDGDDGKNGRQKSLLLDSDVGGEGDARFLPLMDLSRRAVVVVSGRRPVREIYMCDMSHREA